MDAIGFNVSSSQVQARRPIGTAILISRSAAAEHQLQASAVRKSWMCPYCCGWSGEHSPRSKPIMPVRAGDFPTAWFTKGARKLLNPQTRMSAPQFMERLDGECCRQIEHELRLVSSLAPPTGLMHRSNTGGASFGRACARAAWCILVVGSSVASPHLHEQVKVQSVMRSLFGAG